MGKLMIVRSSAISAAAALERIVLPLGHGRLRLVNMNNATVLNPPLRMYLSIRDRGAEMVPISMGISLFHGIDQVESGIDVGWEGDIEIGSGQELLAEYGLSLAGDILYVTVGMEPLP